MIVHFLARTAEDAIPVLLDALGVTIENPNVKIVPRTHLDILGFEDVGLPFVSIGSLPDMEAAAYAVGMRKITWAEAARILRVTLKKPELDL